MVVKERTTNDFSTCAATGHNSSHSRQTLTSLRPSWLRGNVRNGSASDGRGKGCATPTCSWRLLAISLLLTSGLLAAALAYLTGKNEPFPIQNPSFLEYKPTSSPRLHLGMSDGLVDSF